MPSDIAPLTSYNRGYLDGAKWALTTVLKFLAEKGQGELAKELRAKFAGRRVLD
jgi:hypothetical protein